MRTPFAPEKVRSDTQTAGFWMFKSTDKNILTSLRATSHKKEYTRTAINPYRQDIQYGPSVTSGLRMQVLLSEKSTLPVESADRPVKGLRCEVFEAVARSRALSRGALMSVSRSRAQ